MRLETVAAAVAVVPNLATLKVTIYADVYMTVRDNRHTLATNALLTGQWAQVEPYGDKPAAPGANQARVGPPPRSAATLAHGT